MLKAEYTEEEKKEFHELRYNHPDKRIMRLFEILCLHASGKHAPEIATIVKQDVTTVRGVINNFKDGGMALVLTIGSNHPKSAFEKHIDSIKEEFKVRPPATAKEAAARIEKLTGVRRSSDCVRVFMRNVGLKFRKAGAVPAKADLAKQEEFKKSWSQR